MDASAARTRKPCRGAVCNGTGLMSGVLTKKCGRKYSRGAPGAVAVSSVRYCSNSAFVFRHVK